MEPNLDRFSRPMIWEKEKLRERYGSDVDEWEEEERMERYEREEANRSSWDEWL
ncbi:hypothetical protein [Paenibacillus herberti]|uniref:hypothetical protein n=1 Tax=Paenibacillus herberti TaxID=1619309 RepID=UPI001595AABC|nr:hypothetical protein [Paenibacillus herberti]